MNAMLSPADESANKRLTSLGIVLITLSFVGPLVPAALGWGGFTAFRAGEDLIRTLGSLFALSVVAWLITRKRGAMAKANARVVVGVLLCIVVATNIARAQSEHEAAKVFVLEAVKFRDEQAAGFTRVAERFEQIDLATVLTPAGVATPAGLATSRAVIAQYKALLAERNLLVQTYLSKYERFVNERAPNGAARAAAVASMNEASEATGKLYDSLGTAQNALAESIGRVLDWGAAQSGKIGVEKGQLLFASREQQKELQALVAKVNEAEKVVNAVVATAAAAQTKAQAQIADQNRRVEEFIKK